MRVGAIDCGTNSIRLLIADSTTEVVDGVEKTVLKDVVREMRIVRLGQGVDATGWLAQEALDRTFAAAREYAQLLKEHGADSVRFVATSATRDAGNRQVFVDGIRDPHLSQSQQHGFGVHPQDHDRERADAEFLHGGLADRQHGECGR